MRWTHRHLLEIPCPCWRNGGRPSSTVHTQAYTATCWLPAATVPSYRVHPRMRKLLPWDTQSCMLNLTLGSWACLLPLKCSVRLNLFTPFLEETPSVPVSGNSCWLYMQNLSPLFPLCSVCYNVPLRGSSSFMVMVPATCGLPPRPPTYTDTHSKHIHTLHGLWASCSRLQHPMRSLTPLFPENRP